MIKYRFENNKFYRELTLIDEATAKEELGGDRFRKLKRLGECKIRGQETDDTTDLKLLNKYKHFYKKETNKYRTGIKHELWRLNKRYGYYNFVQYLETIDDEDYINKVILTDIKANKEVF